MRLVVALAFTSICSLGSRAQWSDTSRTHDIQDKPRFILNLDVRRQEVRGDIVRFFGLRAGIQERRNIYALGLYGLGDPLQDKGIRLEDIGRDSVDVRSTMGYLSATYERILLDTRHWQLSVPFMVGIGSATVDYKDSTGVYQRYRETRVVPIESGVRASFKVLFWLYLQGGLGYRRVAGPSPLVNKEFSGTTWNFGLSIKFGKIYRYAKDKLEERRERKEQEDGSP
jgi:hypothetical protein